MAPKILIPLPQYGFDPTEAAVPWSRLVLTGCRPVFATPNGKPAEADRRMLTGIDLPALFRKTLMAQPEAVALYGKMAASEEFKTPLSYDQIHGSEFDALLLPGGHDKGMRPYLENSVLQEQVAQFFENNKPVGAICHGTLLAARSQSALTGHSVLWGRKTTGLTRNQEIIAYFITRFSLGNYYRTYETPMADDLVSHLKSPEDFDPGPGWPIPLTRDSEKNLKVGFTVRDGNYLSARWPGDAFKFAAEFVNLLGFEKLK